MTALLEQLWNDESGQALPEYTLLVAAIVVMVVGATVLWDSEVKGLFTSIAGYISGNTPMG